MCVTFGKLKQDLGLFSHEHCGGGDTNSLEILLLESNYPHRIMAKFIPVYCPQLRLGSDITL